MTTAVRPLKKAIIAALKAAVPSVNGAVFTPKIRSEERRFPRLIVHGVMIDNDGFYGRPGNRIRFQIRGEVSAPDSSFAGDDPRDVLYDEVDSAVNNVPLELEGHIHLLGTLRRTASYEDAEYLYFAGTYEGVTRVA